MPPPTDFGVSAISPASAANRPHVFGFETARTTPDDPLLQIRNGPDAEDTVVMVDKDGDIFAGTDQTLVLRLVAGRTAFRLGNFVVEYNSDEDALDFTYEP